MWGQDCLDSSRVGHLTVYASCGLFVFKGPIVRLPGETWEDFAPPEIYPGIPERWTLTIPHSQKGQPVSYGRGMEWLPYFLSPCVYPFIHLPILHPSSINQVYQHLHNSSMHPFIYLSSFSPLLPYIPLIHQPGFLQPIHESFHHPSTHLSIPPGNHPSTPGLLLSYPYTHESNDLPSAIHL